MKSRRLFAAFALYLAASLPAVAGESAAHRFVLGKLAAMEGDPQAALADFERAVALEPDDAYLRLEYGDLLLRLSRSNRGEGDDLLPLAREQAAVAQRLEPENRDALRLRADIELSIAESDPEALETARQLLEQLRRQDPSDLGPMTALGQLYLRQERYSDAAAVFREAIQNHPPSRMLVPMLVDALIKSGEQEQAMSTLRELLAVDPAALEARLALGDLLSERGDHRAAAELLAAAPPEDAARLELRRRLAFELYRIGDLAGARAQLEPVLAAEPDFFGGRYLSALLFEAEARNDDALRELEALRAKAPDNPELAVAVARVRERQGKVDDAVAVLSEAAERLHTAGKLDQAAALRLQMGLTWSRAERWREAAKAVEPLLEAADDGLRSDAVLIYTDALSRQGKGQEALATLDRASGSSAALTAQRAEVLLRLDRRDEAEAILTELGRNGDARARLLVADVYQRFDMWPQAIAALDVARGADPQSREINFRLAAAYERAGRRQEAITAFRGLLAEQPDFAPALNYLGYMFAESGESLDEALSLARRAVDLDPANGAYVDSLGWAHYQRREYDQARDHLERAAGLLPGDATILEHLGDVYRALGDRGRALVAYQKALGLEADNAAEVRRKLAELRSGS